MKQNFLIFSLFFSMSLFAQIEVYDTYHFDSEVEDSVTNSSRAIYKSSNGNSFPTKGVFRGLTIFVCIIYDQNDTIYKHIKHGNGSQYWQKDITNSINSPIYRPTYMKSLFDVDAPNLLKPKYNGVVTRLYAESSFDELILLSDFMVVNILQSQITPNNPGADFDRYALMDSVISYINQNGGLNTIYGHNSISDYDNMTRGSKGLEKPLVPDGRIDFINFLTMNTINNKSKYTINGVNYGDVNWGSGNSGLSPSVKLKMGNSYCDGYNTGTYQCIGHEDITHHKKSILTHEFAHYFLGGNETHTSGGGHNDGGTFLGTQRGYGLYEGGLLTCNAYERWRLGWQSVSNNNYPIAANGINSDIVAQFSGEQTFTLRDFVTYGDAIRIKLPYKDNTTSLNQYICLENHQVGKNSKLDGFKYSEAATCRDVNQAGIYAYYQVGKDILESASSSSDIYPSRESDHLKIISAEGNYNVVYHSNGQDCIGWAGDIG